jgi:hypothetical protein
MGWTGSARLRNVKLTAAPQMFEKKPGRSRHVLVCGHGVEKTCGVCYEISLMELLWWKE